MSKKLAETPVKKAKLELITYLDNFVQDRLVVPHEKIVINGTKFVRKTDVVLTYGKCFKYRLNYIL